MKLARHLIALAAPLWLIAAAGSGSTASASPTPVEVPFRLVDKSAPLVSVRIQGRDIPLWIDLGSSTPLSLHPALLAELKTTATDESFSGVGMEGVVNTVPVVRLAHAELGGIEFSDLAVIPDSHDETYLKNQLPPGRGSVGAGFFAGYKLVFDYHRRRLTLLLPGAPQGACRGKVVPLVQDPAINWGLVSRAATDAGEQLFIWDTGTPGLVMPKSNAQAAGLDASGQTILLRHMRLNGYEFGPLTFEVWDFPVPDRMAGFIGYDFFASHTVCVDFPSYQLLIR